MKRLLLVGALAFLTGVFGGTYLAPAGAATRADSAAAAHEGPADDSLATVAVAPPAAEAASAVTDTARALAQVIDSMRDTAAVPLLNRLPESEVLSLLRHLDLSRAAALIEAMPADRAARLTRALLLGGR